jgi:hypothetical protein
MTGNLGSFISKYHEVANKCRSIEKGANCGSAKIFLVSIPADALLHFDHFNKDGAPSVDLTVKLDMLVVLAVFTFLGAVLLGAF